MGWNHGLHLLAHRSACVLAAAAALTFVSAAGAADDTTASMAKPVNGRDPIKAFSEGVIALDAGRFDQAAAALQQAAEDSPENSDVWRFIGAARAGTKDWAGSRAAYERALKLSPLDVGSHAGLGVALFALGDPRARAEADWMAEKVRTCAGKCVDADYLGAMFDQVQDAAAGKFSPVL